MSRVLLFDYDDVQHTVVRRNVNRFYSFGLKSFPDKYYRVQEQDLYSDLDDDDIDEYKDIINFGLDTHASSISINGDYMIINWQDSCLFIDIDMFRSFNSIIDSLDYEDGSPSYYVLASIQDESVYDFQDVPYYKRPKYINGVHSDSLSDLELMIGSIKLDNGDVVKIA